MADIKVTRIEGTETLHDVERNHNGCWIWVARIKLANWELTTLRGALTQGECAAIRNASYDQLRSNQFEVTL
jgi:hypothetical protein